MSTTTILLQLALAGLYFGSGYLLRHLQAPAAAPIATPASSGSGTVIQHMLAELEAQGTSFIRGIMAQAVQNALASPTAASASPPAPSK